MSAGIRTAAPTPSRQIRISSDATVYGRFSSQAIIRVLRKRPPSVGDEPGKTYRRSTHSPEPDGDPDVGPPIAPAHTGYSPGRISIVAG